MSQTHYKLPIDDEVDADIIEWINKFPRTRKGEMVRQAIRYYMNVLGEGETIKFPSVPQQQVVRVVSEQAPVVSQPIVNQAEQNKRERKRPVFGEMK